MLGRLRAAITPATAVFLALMMLASGLLFGERGEQTGSLEGELSEILSGVEGAGRVQVVISWQTAGQRAQLSLTGAQEEAESVPCGAVAVAQGADDPIVRMHLVRALCAVLGLPASAVSVVKGGM